MAIPVRKKTKYKGPNRRRLGGLLSADPVGKCIVGDADLPRSVVRDGDEVFFSRYKVNPGLSFFSNKGKGHSGTGGLSERASDRQQLSGFLGKRGFKLDKGGLIVKKSGQLLNQTEVAYVKELLAGWMPRYSAGKRRTPK